MSIYGGRYELLAHNCFFRRKFRPPLAKAVGFYHEFFPIVVTITRFVIF